ncbi:uncharacterized protein LAESUDRAFT_439724 [Laetiporus sulphureus 93-53]|uniref:Uncharacterized protein n=1 Tax=Laetiporus sulphureus 93-53 TaxID=1314785 RepID=A0A165C1Y9_9APHY|nr:uncharacterized protein LAESUDRAFT_439724 [Laetiporus sulphureus 93-53]KZT02056.1 hypothetical protein LAESUDRAFT_439724 [Laetiporus sulphureus 93-53]
MLRSGPQSISRPPNYLNGEPRLALGLLQIHVSTYVLIFSRTDTRYCLFAVRLHPTNRESRRTLPLPYCPCGPFRSRCGRAALLVTDCCGLGGAVDGWRTHGAPVFVLVRNHHNSAREVQESSAVHVNRCLRSFTGFRYAIV